MIISNHAYHIGQNVAKFRGLTSSTPKVIGADSLNFKPIFDPQ